MSTRHRWADEIIAWANGEAIQWRTELNEEWRDWVVGFSSTPHFAQPGAEWRIKPRLCSLNGHEFPAPESEAPERGAKYFFPIPSHCDLYGDCMPWTGMRAELLLLRRGRVHLTKDAAIAHARAEILAVGGTLEDES